MKTKTALVFDDNNICRILLSEILMEKDYEVTDFSDPTCFLDQQEQPCCSMDSEPCCDVVLTDNQMPGMTGLDFFEWLKKKGCKIPRHRMAIVSGNWSNDDLTRAQGLGCRVLYKPTSIDEVFKWLGECESPE